LKQKALQDKISVMKLYDLIADEYETSENLRLTRLFEECEFRVINCWFKEFKSPVLDVGCGVGRYAVKLAEQGFEVIALDFSTNMIKKLKSKLRNCFNLHVVRADAEHLPLKNCSISTLICTLSFNHFTQPIRVVSEFYRVLNSSGRCIISTINDRLMKLCCMLGRYPKGYVPFKVGNVIVLVFEKGLSADKLIRLFNELSSFRVVQVKYCCSLPYLILSGAFKMHGEVTQAIDRIASIRDLSVIHVVYLVKL